MRTTLDQEPSKSIQDFLPEFIYGIFPSKVMKQQGKGKYCIALHCNPIVKPCSSKLSMSRQGESSLQEFQHFLESLYFRINKRLNSNLITIEINKVVEVHLNARDVKKKNPYYI
jgi:hypothetical protein